jgi:hypothetical protein
MGLSAAWTLVPPRIVFRQQPQDDGPFDLPILGRRAVMLTHWGSPSISRRRRETITRDARGRRELRSRPVAPKVAAPVPNRPGRVLIALARPLFDFAATDRTEQTYGGSQERTTTWSRAIAKAAGSKIGLRQASSHPEAAIL